MRELLEFLIEHAEEVEVKRKAMGLTRTAVMTNQGLVYSPLPTMASVCGCPLCIKYADIRARILKMVV